MSINWELPLKIEQDVQRIITQQEINGWYFDTDLATQRVQQLEDNKNEIYEEVRPLLKKQVINRWTEVTKPFTRAGRVISRVASHINPDVVAGPLNIVDFEEPDLGKRTQLMVQLEHIGWKPLEYTDKGNPKLTEESLLFLEGDLGKKIAKWYIYAHRQSQIEGWIRRVREDHRITAGADTCGTNTGRMRHRTVVNVPKADPSVLFGKEMRELFTVPSDEFVLVGHDASGLEARMLGHYLNDGELIYEIIHGDFHTKVWDTIREFIATRNKAKAIEYALIYGASDRKLGSMADNKPRRTSDTKIGEEIRRCVMTGIPALGDLVEATQKEAEKGYLIGLDGRRIPIRSIHSALNARFQSSGAIVMKVSMILLDKWLKREGITLEEVKKVGDFHDEGQAEVRNNKEIIELYSNCAVKSIQEAGEFFKLNLPLAAESMVGKTWADTH